MPKAPASEIGEKNVARRGGGRQLPQCGITREIAATVAERAFDWLDAPAMRLGGAVPIPFSKSLEPLVLPDPPRLASEIAALVRGQ